MSYVIQRSESAGSIWKNGDTIYGQEPDGSWYAVACTKPRVLGPRGGLKEPAEYVTLTARTWRGIREAFKALGYQPPVRHRV